MGQQRRIAGRRLRFGGAAGAVLVAAVASLASAPTAVAQVDGGPNVRNVEVVGDEVVATVFAPPQLRDERLPADAWTLQSDDGPVPISTTLVPPEDLELVVVPDPGFGEWSSSARRTVARFVDELPARMPAGVVLGSGTAAVLPPSTDRADVVAALQEQQPADGADLLSRLEAAVATFSQREDARRVLVVLSSGGYELAPGQEAVVREALDRSRVDTFAIAFDPVGVGLPPVFTPIALRGGRTDDASDERLLADRLAAIRSDVANRYEVRFRAPRVTAAQVDYRLRVQSGDVSGQAPMVVDLRPTPARVGRETGSRPLQLLGLVGVLALTGLVLVVPARLTRRRADRRRRRVAAGPPASVVTADAANGLPVR